MRLEGEEVIYWPAPVVFDYEQLAIVCDRTAALYAWKNRLPQESRRCERCNKRFVPRNRTADFCSSRCYTTEYQRKQRRASGVSARAQRRPGFCVKGHRLADVGVLVDKNGYTSCRQCSKDRARRSNERKRGTPVYTAFGWAKRILTQQPEAGA